MAEAVVWPRMNQLETGPFVDMAGGQQDTIRPKSHSPVAGAPGKADTFIDQATAETQAAGAGLDEQQAELGHGFRLFNQEYRANIFAVSLRNPTSLPFRLIILEEFGHDAGYQGLELL